MLEKLLDKGKKFLAGATIISSTFLSQNLNAQEKPWNFFVEGTNTWTETHTFMYEVSNVPERLRYVPIHADDTYASEENNGIIPNKTVKRKPFYFLINPSISLGAIYETGKINLEIGAKAEYHLLEPSFFTLRNPKNVFKTFTERNYTNYPGTDIRGEGAALTYYGLANGDISKHNDEYSIFVRPSIYPVYLEYELELSHLFLTRGWDRNNSLVTWKSSKLADILTHNFILGVRNFGLGEVGIGKNIHAPIDLSFGVSFPQPIKTSLGKEVDLKTKPHFFFRFGIGINHVFYRYQK